jgi:predicted enzyme related to lactoylglutathione lyase
MSNADIRGRFVWHELMTTDPDAASDFYSRVVPWTTQDSGMPSYTLFMSGKNRAAGLMALPEDDSSGTPPHWIIYIATPDVDESVVAAEKLGGKVLKAASDIPNVGRFAVLSDPQGAAFAAFTPSPSAEAMPAASGPGDFGWHELATTDPEGALSFYTELFGWSKGAAHDMGEMGAYHIISHEGKDVGGIYKARDNSTPPSWLSYVNVVDTAKVAAATKAAGGRVVNGPMEVPGGSWIVMMLDPQGGAFAVVEPPRAAAAKPPKASKPTAAKKKAQAAASGAPPKTAVEPVEGRSASAAPKKSPPKKAPAKKAPAKKTAAKKAPAKKAPAKKAPAKKSAGKAAAKKAVAKKPPAAKRAAAKKSTSAKRGSAAKKAPIKKGAKKKAKSKK